MKNMHHHLRKTLVNVAMLGIVLLSLLGTPQPVSAASIRVNVFKDVYGDGKSTCSLREAIHSANNDIAFDGCAAGQGSDTILLSSGTYEISREVTNYKADAEDEKGQIGDLDISSSMLIVGAGELNTTIKPVAGAKTRIFHIISPSANVTIQQLTLTNGYAYDDISDPTEPTYETLGGAVFNQYGSLTMWRTTVAANKAYHSGGGIFSNRDAKLYILDSTIRDNTAILGDGGGIASESKMLLMRSLILKNTSQGGNGGGIYNSDSGRIAHTTITENVVKSTQPEKGRGSGIYADQVMEVLNSTVVRNVSAARDRYGFEAVDGQAVIFNNIIAYNTALVSAISYPANCLFNASVVGAYNYREVDELGGDGKPICTGSAGSEDTFFFTEPNINLSASLEFNLGRTKSYALEDTSAVIDMGKPDNRFTHPNSGQRYYCTGADQRWAALPIDGDGDGSRVCDPGAVEYAPEGVITHRNIFLPAIVR